MELVTKSRDLSLTDFYSILQKEFISYYIRSKTYPPEYAKKYENYCICKKEKIEKIGQKNSLPSIFNSQTTKDRFLDQFFNAYGLPNFEYRDDNSHRIMGRWDSVYWFGEGTSVKVRVDGDMVTAVVIKNLFTLGAVVVEIDGVTKQFNYDYVTRLITDKITGF